MIQRFLWSRMVSKCHRSLIKNDQSIYRRVNWPAEMADHRKYSHLADRQMFKIVDKIQSGWLIHPFICQKLFDCSQRHLDGNGCKNCKGESQNEKERSSAESIHSSSTLNGYSSWMDCLACDVVEFGNRGRTFGHQSNTMDWPKQIEERRKRFEGWRGQKWPTIANHSMEEN